MNERPGGGIPGARWAPLRLLAVTPELRGRIRAGLVWSFVATAFTAGGSFVIGLVVANLLGREDFGRFSILRSTLLTVTALAPLATGLTATKFVAEFRASQKEKAGRILGMCAWICRAGGLTAAGGLLLLAPWLSRDVLKSEALTEPLRWTGAAALFLVLSTFYSGVLSGLEAFRAVAFNAVASGCVHVVLVGAGGLINGLRGAVIGLAAGSVVQWLLLYVSGARELSHQGIRVAPAHFRSELPLLKSFALPAALSGLSLMPAFWLANTFLARQPGGYGQLGLFGAGNTVKTLVLFVPGLIFNVTIALLNNQRGVGRSKQYFRLFWTSLGATAAVAAAAAGGVVVFGHFILRRFGPAFDEGYGVLVILAVGAIFEACMRAAYQLVQAEGHMWIVLTGIVIPRDATLVGLAYLLTSGSGATGLALAYTAAQAVGLGGALVASVRLARRAIRESQSAHAALPLQLDTMEP